MAINTGLLLAGAGIAGGGILGAVANKQDRYQGAAYGVAGGAGIATAAKMYSNYKASPKLFAAIKKVPFKGVAGLGLAVAAAGIAGLAMTPSLNESESTAVPNGMAGYDTQETSRNYSYGLSDRIASMNVSGDIVFGLHNKRHG